MTTDHENSLAAFRAMLHDGSISNAKLRVAHELWRNPGGLTRNELDRNLDPGAPNSRYSRRLAELERTGICARSGSRACAVSGNTCEVWVYAPHEPEVLAPVARMPSPLEAAQLLEHLATQIVPWDMIPQTRVLRAWLAAGAPRCVRARAIPPGQVKPKPAPVEVTA